MDPTLTPDKQQQKDTARRKETRDLVSTSQCGSDWRPKHKEAMSCQSWWCFSMPGQEQHFHSPADTVLNVTIRSMAASSCND
jgi:hypothetical protein